MKILASDFDNTLYFHNSMKENDGICTGREINGIIEPSKEFDIQ